MRIFLSCQQALRPHAVPAYAFWEYYFKNALSEAGHDVVEAPGVDWAEGLTALCPAERRAWLDRTWQLSLDCLRRQPADLFLGYLYPFQVEPSGLAAVRALGIPTVNFFCDNVREFVRVPDPFRGFDLHWVPEAEARPFYTAAGLRFVPAPMAVWIPPRFRTLPATESGNVVFAGSHDVLREDLLGEAVARGLRLTVHGAAWIRGGAEAAESPPRPPGRWWQSPSPPACATTGPRRWSRASRICCHRQIAACSASAQCAQANADDTP